MVAIFWSTVEGKEGGRREGHRCRVEESDGREEGLLTGVVEAEEKDGVSCKNEGCVSGEGRRRLERDSEQSFDQAKS